MPTRASLKLPAARTERYAEFLEDALRADNELKRAGKYYEADDVFRYMAARAEGRKVRRPRPRTWHK